MSENGSASSHDELYLIDGSSLAYRAFFALPESIATSTGVLTNAIFGFALDAGEAAHRAWRQVG